jgi:glycosyltransferase involved in cell wall biosynthesis
MRIAIAANSGWYLYNFRRALMGALREAGHRPVAISPHDEYIERLIDDGFDFIDFPLDAAGTNPMQELSSVRQLRRLLRGGRFDAAFTWTPKANIYFGLAAKGLRLQHVPNVSGLGRVFIDESWLTPLVRRLYRTAFQNARVVIFQNDDDQREFTQLGLVRADRCVRVPGSGVDLSRFSPVALPAGDHGPVFLFIGRILRDKGVVELVDAARAVKARHPSAVFRLVGSIGANNPTAVPADEVQRWADEGVVEVLGATDDVRPALAVAHCVVLPSYREGVPRVLLEAAAMARPCIATDVPGCRDAVDDGVTGIFCEVRNAQSLAAAIERFISLGLAERAEMGRQGRLKVERQFDERIVLDTYTALAEGIERDARRRLAA